MLEHVEKWATREAKKKINKAENWKGTETLGEGVYWSQNMWSYKVIYYISTFISARESRLIKRTKLKDIQACSRESVKEALMTRLAEALFFLQALHIVLHGKSLTYIWAPQIHTDTHTWTPIHMQRDSSKIKMQKQLNASHNSADSANMTAGLWLF